MEGEGLSDLHWMTETRSLVDDDRRDLQNDHSDSTESIFTFSLLLDSINIVNSQISCISSRTILKCKVCSHHVNFSSGEKSARLFLATASNFTIQLCQQTVSVLALLSILLLSLTSSLSPSASVSVFERCTSTTHCHHHSVVRVCKTGRKLNRI